jgi:hypothetical protein
MDSLIGQSIGRYRILERIGSGGMAVVYKAIDTHLDAPVAIKVIQPGIQQDEKFLKRFEREARTLARLSHPNIVRTIDYGAWKGMPFLVMAYVGGGTLKEKLGTPMPAHEAAQTLIPVALALHSAHKLGIIHRDVKPSNILLTEGSDPLLSDFGVARLEDNEQHTQLTSTGGGVGTPDYMPAEQWEGKALTEPVPSARKFVPDLPAEIEAILNRAMGKTPEDRYPDLLAFANALKRIPPPADAAGQIAGLTIRERPPEQIPASWEKPPKRLKKVKSPILAAAPPISTDLPTADILAAEQARSASRIARPWKWIGLGALSVALVLAAVLVLPGLLGGQPEVPTQVAAVSTEINSPSTETATPTLHPTISATVIKATPTPTKIPSTATATTPPEPSPTPTNIAGRVALSPVNADQVQVIRKLKSLNGEAVNALAFSPDTRFLAAASDSKVIYLWDTTTWELSGTIKGHTSRVYGLAFSADGKYLASVSFDQTVRVWEFPSGNQVTKLDLGESLDFVKFLGDGKTLAVGGNKYGFLVDWQTQAIIKRINIAEVRVQGLEKVPAERESGSNMIPAQVNDVSSDGNIWFIVGFKYDLATEEIKEFGMVYWGFYPSPQAYFSPDEKYFAAGSGLYDRETGDLVKSYTSSGNLTRFSKGSSLIISAVTDAIHLHNGLGERYSRKIEEHPAKVTGLAFAQDGTIFASCDPLGNVWVWGLQN